MATALPKKITVSCSLSNETALEIAKSLSSPASTTLGCEPTNNKNPDTFSLFTPGFLLCAFLNAVILLLNLDTPSLSTRDVASIGELTILKFFFQQR